MTRPGLTTIFHSFNKFSIYFISYQSECFEFRILEWKDKNGEKGENDNEKEQKVQKENRKKEMRRGVKREGIKKEEEEELLTRTSISECKRATFDETSSHGEVG